MTAPRFILKSNFILIQHFLKNTHSNKHILKFINSLSKAQKAHLQKEIYPDLLHTKQTQKNITVLKLPKWREKPIDTLAPNLTKHRSEQYAILLY